MKKEYKAWAGITGNTIDETKETNNGYRIMAIFPVKKTAKLAYECVVPCKIELLIPSSEVKE